MTIRYYRRVLLGMGALLGLSAAGCQNGLVNMRPSGLLEVMAARREARPTAEILRPRAVAMRSSPAPIASSIPVAPAPVQPLIVRASAEEMPGVETVASSWRPVNAASEPELIGGNPLTLEGPIGAAPAEQLPAPRQMASSIHGKTVSAHIVHGMPPHMVMHGSHHGVVHGAEVPREGSKAALPPYVIEPPDVLEVQLLRDPKRVPQPIGGVGRESGRQFLVRPDGTILLGVYGVAHVGGKTLEEAKAEVLRVFRTRLEDYEITDDTGKKRSIKLDDEVIVDVLEYASKFCYLIADGGGHGAQVTRIPVSGSDTVLDTIGRLGGLPPQAAKKKIWLARPSTGQLLPVDWKGVSSMAQVATNYQVFPGDRIYVQSDPRIRFLTHVESTIAPFERLAGGVLLGASMKNALTSGRNGNNNNNSGN